MLKTKFFYLDPQIPLSQQEKKINDWLEKNPVRIIDVQSNSGYYIILYTI